MPRDRAGGVLGAFNGRLGGKAGFVTEILDARAGALEMGAELGCLIVEPAPDSAEEAGLLGRRARIAIGALLRQRQRGGEQDRARANARQQRASRRSSGETFRNAMGAHGRSN